jgi:uncharacterized surface protein with fasciclin (FAS1) repeats
MVVNEMMVATVQGAGDHFGVDGESVMVNDATVVGRHACIQRCHPRIDKVLMPPDGRHGADHGTG